MLSPSPSQSDIHIRTRIRVFRRHRRLLRHRLSVIAITSSPAPRLAKIAIAIITMIDGFRHGIHVQ